MSKITLRVPLWVHKHAIPAWRSYAHSVRAYSKDTPESRNMMLKAATLGGVTSAFLASNWEPAQEDDIGAFTVVTCMGGVFGAAVGLCWPLVLPVALGASIGVIRRTLSNKQ